MVRSIIDRINCCCLLVWWYSLLTISCYGRILPSVRTFVYCIFYRTLIDIFSHRRLITDILIDLVLLLLSISAFIATIVTLNAPIQFKFIYKVHDIYNPHYDSTTSYRYYDTLHTFSLNFSDCLQSSDPTILISASSVTLFLSMVMTYTSLRITFQDYIDKLRVESKHKVGNEAEFQGMLAPDPTAV